MPRFETIRVTKDELRQIHATPVELTVGFGEADFQVMWRHVRDALRGALRLKWIEDCCGRADFAIGDDWTLSWSQCGGVYSARICCPDYTETLLQVLRHVPESYRWAYSTAVENLDGHPGFPIPRFSSGEFVVRAGRIYVPEDSFDYASFFGS